MGTKAMAASSRSSTNSGLSCKVCIMNGRMLSSNIAPKQHRRMGRYLASIISVGPQRFQYIRTPAFGTSLYIFIQKTLAAF
eukprot:g72647.t1